MAYSTPWIRPYETILKALPPSDIIRITVEIPRSDADAIKAVTLTPAILPTLCQYAIQQTADACRSHSLTYSDFPRFCEYIRERTYSEFVKETVAPDAGGGASAVRGGTPDSGDVTAKSREGTPSRSSSEGKEVGGGRGKGVGKGKSR